MRCRNNNHHHNNNRVDYRDDIMFPILQHEGVVL